MSEQPSYYAIIPASVRYANITPNAKLLYGEITALSEARGYCWATNDYFGKLYRVQKTTISDWVGALERIGAIRCEMVKTGEGFERRIEISEAFGKSRRPPSAFSEDPPSGNPEDNTTRGNTTSNNPPVVPRDARFEEFWQAYPHKVGKPKAKLSWRSNKLNDCADAILAGVENWKQSQQWRRDQGKFIPHPTTFLNQRRWEDSPQPERPPTMFEGVEPAF